MPSHCAVAAGIIRSKSIADGGCGHLEDLLNTGESPQLVLAVSRNCCLMSPKIECCRPVLSLYYDQAQSRQHPKRGTASTKLVLRSSTIQPASETRHSQYSIRNKHFSDMPGPGDLMNFEIETKTGQSEEWRRAYYDKPRAWELPGPQPGDQNAITKRFQEQQEFATDDMPLPRRTFLEACSAKALSLSRAATKKRRKHAKLTKKSSSSSGSSSTSSSSTSSSAS